MIERKLLTLIFVGLSLSIGACSSSQVSEDGETLEDPVLEAEAVTDELPIEGVEELAQPTDTTTEESFQEPVSEPVESVVGATTGGAEFVGTGETEDYAVRSGDTLMKIAFEVYGDLFAWRRIYDANRDKIPDPNQIPQGVTLKIEKPAEPVSISRNGIEYQIKAGDTLGTISSEVYGTPRKWRKIYENNRQLIKDPNRIYAGFKLYYVMTPEDEAEKQQFLGANPLAGNVRDAGATGWDNIQPVTPAASSQQRAPADVSK